MHRIFAIIENTFKESLRQRIFFVVAIFAAILVIVSIFIEPFALGETSRIIRDVGLAITTIFSMIIVIYIGSQLLYKEYEKRTLYTIITSPVNRSEIIIGKFIGLIALVAIQIIAMMIIQQIIILIYEGSPDMRLFIAAPFTVLEAMLMLSILLLFSSFSSPALASVMGFLFYVIGHATTDLKALADGIEIPVTKYLVYGFYYMLPNLENLNFRIELVNHFPISTERLIFGFTYGILYVILLIYITVLIFEKQELK
ncbi:hypothetical protein A2Y85_05120 [candidate division WOR-3 bacterium RBG_13_43_14]|uniref:ABC transporter permease n=1 Tax=candidate division WOR-3 bacterium RBG_13_43_14 TaxID=1802590 RepID=A0A1F4U8A6_UNCW3|nr:MAG: hypothetical protein A2Y85_05120 [candidate division WOR-3 bacterium RBG_13_43_14]